MFKNKKNIVLLIIICVVSLMAIIGFKIYKYYNNREEIENTIAVYKTVGDFQFMDVNLFYNDEDEMTYFTVVVENNGTKDYNNIDGIKVKFINKYGKEKNYMLYAMQDDTFYANSTIFVSLSKKIEMNLEDIYNIDYEIIYK